MAPDGVVDPEDQEPERHVDPSVAELIDRDLRERMGPVTEYARREIQSPFWPIGLCVAWVLGPDPSRTTDLYARHRVGTELRPVDGWAEAQTRLVQALGAGRIEALGIPIEGGERAPIPARRWIDLRIVQRGPYDEVRGADGSIAYRDVRVAATQMRKEWRPETQAVKTARERRASEKACLARLKELMRANPTAPVPKASLRPDFPDVSNRAFDRLYSQAVRDSGSSAWSAPGRRPRISRRD